MEEFRLIPLLVINQIHMSVVIGNPCNPCYPWFLFGRHFWGRTMMTNVIQENRDSQ